MILSFFSVLLRVHQTCTDGVPDTVAYRVALMTRQCFPVLRGAASDCSICAPVEVAECPFVHAKLLQFPQKEKVPGLVCSSHQ